MINSLILSMMNQLPCNNVQDAINNLREIMQDIALLALSRNDFFKYAAFYGGTALRIIYGLNRGSEDMDFSLLSSNDSFELNDYALGIENEFASFGLTASFSRKIKMQSTNIQSGFLKSNTQTQMLAIGIKPELAKLINVQSEIKIKIEVDVHPPLGFETEMKYLFQPIPFEVRCYTLPDLLAGKLHAVLYRTWKNRVKGRDWYDLLWYAGAHPQYNLRHLENRARQSGDYSDEGILTAAKVKSMLMERLEKVNIEDIKSDVSPFIKNAGELQFWSKELFREAFSRLTPKED